MMVSRAMAVYQLALAAANGDHRVDGLDAGLQRPVNAFAFNDTGGWGLDGARLLGNNGAFAVDGLA